MMLKITDLRKTYSNGVQALKGISLDIPRGLFGLLGPNGAGKSTLMRTIATLQEADSGAITFGDVDVLRHKNHLRQVLGYLPQELGLYPTVRAQALLEHLAVLNGLTDVTERRRTVERLLRTTNLWELRSRKLGSFSGGMRRRFGIAQALLGDPQLLIVDEPTAGLDPDERRRFLNLLSDIGETVAVVLSTHIVDDVNETCTTVAIIDKGEVLLVGVPYDLITGLEGKTWFKSICGW